LRTSKSDVKELKSGSSETEIYRELDSKNSKFDGISSKFNSVGSRIEHLQKSSFMTEHNSYESLLGNEVASPHHGFKDLGTLSEIIIED
jgi:hypothetical protein